MKLRERNYSYWYLMKSFLIIGSISFGGYLSLIGIVRDKLVLRDKVIEDDRITEAIALASLLPGPLAVNIVGYIGYHIAGMLGAIISIICVLFPSYLLLLLLSILYFDFNSLVDFDSILKGIIPVVIAIILSMAVGMWKKNCTNLQTILVALFSLVSLLIFNSYWTIVFVIIISGFFGILVFKQSVRGVTNTSISVHKKYLIVLLFIVSLYVASALIFSKDINFELFHRFATVSVTLFGGGYVMIPVLKTLLVDQLQWLTIKEFFLGISLGQVTPGPILISAVFFGYKVNGVVGSLFASIGIFFPSSLLMILTSKFFAQISRNHLIVSALQGVKPAIVGFIIYAAFSLTIADSSFANIAYLIPLIFIVFLILLRFKISPVIAVILGGTVGYLMHFF